MKEIIIVGWVGGFNKVGCTKILREELGLTISEAKSITDKILENEKVKIKVTENHDVEALVKTLTALGARAKC